MSNPHLLELTVEYIREALKTQRFGQATTAFLELRPADQAEIFNTLDDDEQGILLQHLDIPATADLFDELEDEDTLDAAENLTLERLADVLDEMDPDEAADLLGDLPPKQADEALAQMDDPEDVIPLLGYPDETAGGRMTTAFIGLRPHTTAETAIRFLRDVSLENDVPYYLFVIDREKRLIGVTGLRELVIASPQATMDHIMEPDVIHITADRDQEEAARIMTRYDLSALPVVDEQGRLVGVITHDDILDVLEDEATEDIYRLASVADTDLELESDIYEQLKGRLPWLLLNTGTALFASWIISNFGDLFIQVAVLAFFQSVVTGQGGNAASQNVAMIVRSLALGKVSAKQVWPIFFRQLAVSLMQGSIIGLIVGLGVGLWQQNPYLGLVLGLALVGNMLVAGVVGTLTPLALKSLGQDPALASTVLVTAATDSFGFLIFLSLAKVFLPYIQLYL
ncbi:MAG: magnesium transporter [Chloroflexota bacterium]